MVTNIKISVSNVLEKTRMENLRRALSSIANSQGRK